MKTTVLYSNTPSIRTMLLFRWT